VLRDKVLLSRETEIVLSKLPVSVMWLITYVIINNYVHFQVLDEFTTT